MSEQFLDENKHSWLVKGSATDEACTQEKFNKMKFVNITDSEYDCVEDEVSMNITNTVFTGIVIKNFTILFTFIFLVWINGRLLGKPEKQWKKPFKVPSETIGFLAFQFMTNMVGVYFPPMIIISPILYFFLFKAIKL